MVRTVPRSSVAKCPDRGATRSTRGWSRRDVLGEVQQRAEGRRSTASSLTATSRSSTRTDRCPRRPLVREPGPGDHLETRRRAVDPRQRPRPERRLAHHGRGQARHRADGSHHIGIGLIGLIEHVEIALGGTLITLYPSSARSIPPRDTRRVPYEVRRGASHLAPHHGGGRADDPARGGARLGRRLRPRPHHGQAGHHGTLRAVVAGSVLAPRLPRRTDAPDPGRRERDRAAVSQSARRRKGRGHRRPGLGRALHLRHRRGLGRGRVQGSRLAVLGAWGDGRRVPRDHQGGVVGRRAELYRPLPHVRRGDVRAAPRSDAASADMGGRSAGRPVRPRHAPGRPPLRRLASARPRLGRARARHGDGPRAGGQGWPAEGRRALRAAESARPRRHGGRRRARPLCRRCRPGRRGRQARARARLRLARRSTCRAATCRG